MIDPHGNVITRQMAEDILGRKIEQGKARSTQIVTALYDEVNSRESFIVPKSELHFAVSPENGQLTADVNHHGKFSFTDHARGQALKTLHVNQTQYDFLTKTHREDGGPAILSDFLNKLRDLTMENRRMIRTVNGQVRGFMTQDYQTIDADQTVTQLMKSLTDTGAVFLGGELSDWRYALDLMLPKIEEPLPGEFVLPIVRFRSGDYGDTAAEMTFGILRLICGNGLVREVIFRKVHSGGGQWKIETGVVEISDKARELSAALVIEKMNTSLKYAFSENGISKMMTQYAEAAETPINAARVAGNLQRAGLLTKPEADQVVKLVREEDRIEVLPKTDKAETQLRFEQALAFIAQQSPDSDRRMDLVELAGQFKGRKAAQEND